MMKTILAPVDFSDISINAIAFAAELTRRTSARLIVIHIIEQEKTEEKAKNKLQKLESDLCGSIDFNLNVEFLLAHGNLINTLNKTIAAQRPDLIVMGTKGASGLKKLLIGSNTVNVIAMTRVPVLVIPEVARFEHFLNKEKTRIVLATDLESLENEDSLGILKEIALLISNPKLRVLSVRPKNTRLAGKKRMERDFLLSFFNPGIESERVTIFSSNVISGINYYLSEHPDTGLVAMIARDSGHLIQKHYTREMASYTYLPLLVMHD